MDLREIKTKIKHRELFDLPVVFLYEDNDFIPNQYIRGMKKIQGVEIVNIDSIDDIDSSYFLDTIPIYVYRCETLKKTSLPPDNLIIVTKSISKDALPYYNKYIVKIPVLEKWQIEEYVRTECQKLNERAIKWLTNTYSDMYQLENEVDKIKIFPPDTRSYIFDDLYRENEFNIPLDDAVLRLAPAVQDRNLEEIKDILLHQNVEKEPFAIIAFLQTTFRKLIKVWLNKTPTPENTGLKPNQIYAINKLPRIFSRDKLIDILEMLSGLDNKIRMGEFPSELTLDYVLIRILQ